MSLLENAMMVLMGGFLVAGDDPVMFAIGMFGLYLGAAGLQEKFQGRR